MASDGSPSVPCHAHPRASAARRTLVASLAVVPLALAAGAGALSAQSTAWSAEQRRYHDHARLTRALDSLRRAHPQLVQVTELARSPGERAVHVVRIAAGADADARPALLVLANAYGPHLVGSEIALAAVRDLAGSYGRDTAVTALLDRATIYVMPRLNPDAAEAFFARPLAERVRNAAATDEDRDGRVDEDGPADLNGDGIVGMMRVQDPTGAWMPDPDEPLVMRRADRARGEAGGWRVLTEARDVDGDGEIGEDPAGGTDVSRNFSNGYRFFTPGSGPHSFSSEEARAVAEFYVSHPNVAAVYVLGQHDNLMKPWEHRRQAGIGGNPQGTSAGGPFTSILAPDAPYFAEVSRRYQRATGASGSPASAPLEGDPASHAYFDMGRFAFASRGWWPQPARDTSARREAGEAREDASVTEAKTAVRWLRANRPELVREWTAVSHPDFPGQVVEVGGIAPFAAINPPVAALDSVTGAQTRFIRELAGMLPRLTLRDVRVERVGDGVFRVTAQVGNDGYLPTLAAIGERADWPRRVRVDLDLQQGQSLASGRRVQLLGAIPGSGGTTEVSWLVVGTAGSRLSVRAASPVAGSASRTITLQAR